MFGKVINKIGVVANNQNSAYYHLHKTISKFTDNNKNDKTSYYGDIHNKIFADCLDNDGLSNTDIRYMTARNRTND